MATYQGIKGRTVQNLASDPPASVGLGQVWYNTATDVLKASVSIGAWASGTNLPTPGQRYSMPGFGILTAGVLVGGYSGPTATDVSETTEYDGTSWALGGVMIQQASDNAASGTQTAGFTAAGYGGDPVGYTATSATYDGTSWTAAGSVVDGARGIKNNQSAGTETAGMIYGAQDAGNTSHETFDGSSWTAATDMNVARGSSAGMGVQTAAIACAGGYPNTATLATTEEWDGATWAAGGTLNQARNKAAGGPGGSSYNNAWLGGGSSSTPALIGNTESYDGSTWTAEAVMANTRNSYGSFGTKTSGVVAGGAPGPTDMEAVEEFTLVDTIQTITST